MQVIIILISLFLFGYVVFIRRQLHSINRQLKRQLQEGYRGIIRVQLFDRECNELCLSLNTLMKMEEEERVRGLREERKFRDMIADLSHDLRTPLTAIKGYQQLIRKEGLTESQSLKLTTAQRHTDELGVLIEHFFEYSVLTGKEPELHPEPVNLTQLIIEYLAGFIMEFESKGLKINWSEEASVFAFADREALGRIIQNLIRNALQHADGDVIVRVGKRQMAEILFSNPVRGLTYDQAEHIFDRFFSKDHARGKSSGLGLAIVKLLAEQMGGSVSSHLNGEELEIQVLLPLSG